MKLLTRDTDYAVRALCFIAKSEKKIVCVTEMARELKIPRPFLRKILQKLNKGRFLNSYKGTGGGFSLAGEVDNILLTDLIRTFQGALELNECHFKKKPCPNKGSCALKRKIDAIEEQVYRQLSSVTVGKLLKEGRG